MFCIYTSIIVHASVVCVCGAIYLVCAANWMCMGGFGKIVCGGECMCGSVCNGVCGCNYTENRDSDLGAQSSSYHKA